MKIGTFFIGLSIATTLMQPAIAENNKEVDVVLKLNACKLSALTKCDDQISPASEVAKCVNEMCKPQLYQSIMATVGAQVGYDIFNSEIKTNDMATTFVLTERVHRRIEQEKLKTAKKK